MDNAVERALPTHGNVEEWTDAQKAMMEAAGLVYVDGDKRIGAPRPVVEAFLHQCRRTGLDPWVKQIHCIARWTKTGIRWTTQVGIDGFRLIAERTKELDGYGDDEWTADGVNWVDVWVPSEEHPHPIAARATVYRKGWERPVRAVADWKFYAQTKRDGSLTDMWTKGDAFMLAKCANALALRKAFPNDLSGIYTTEEAASGAADLIVEASDEPTPMTEEATAPVIDAEPDEGQPDRVAAYIEAAEAANTGDDVLAIYNLARSSGDLGAEVGWPRLDSEHRLSLKDYLTRLGEGLGGSSRKLRTETPPPPASWGITAERPDVGIDFDPSAGLQPDEEMMVYAEVVDEETEPEEDESGE